MEAWTTVMFSFPLLLSLPCSSLLDTLWTPSHPCPYILVLWPSYPSLMGIHRTPACPYLISSPLPLSSDTPEHWTPIDLWIFPGSSPDLPFLPWTPISGSSLVSLLLFHLHLHPLLPCHYQLPLISLLSLIPCNTIDFLFTLTHCHFVIDLLSYSLDSTMTHYPWLIASFPLVYKPLVQHLYSDSKNCFNVW